MDLLIAMPLFSQSWYGKNVSNVCSLYSAYPCCSMGWACEVQRGSFKALIALPDAAYPLRDGGEFTELASSFALPTVLLMNAFCSLPHVLVASDYSTNSL